MRPFNTQSQTIQGDSNREAVDALEGYAYQIYLSAIAWVQLDENEILFLEVAEDFAVVANDELEAQQVKKKTRSLTLNSPEAATALDGLVQLHNCNPGHRVRLVFHTTAKAGKEHKKDRILGKGGLEYWRAVQNNADPGPLRKRVLSLNLRSETKSFITELSDEQFVDKIVSRLDWRCGQQSPDEAKKELEEALICYGKHADVHPEDCQIASSAIIAAVLDTARKKDRRTFTKREFEELFQTATSTRIDNSNLRCVANAFVHGQPIDLVDREINSLTDELWTLRFFTEYSATKNAKILAERVWRGNLQQGTPAVRARSLAWCARLLSVESTWDQAKQYLAAAEQIGESPEVRVARTLLENQYDLQNAVSGLLNQNSPLARSAALIRIRNEKGVSDAHKWFQAACSTVDDLDGCGKTALLAGLLHEALWDDAFALADQIDLDDLGIYPCLYELVAISLTARTAPPEHRFMLLHGVPFDADRYKLSDAPEDRIHRQKAARLFDQLEDIAMQFDLKETSRNAGNFALWLRLRLPTERVAALQKLKQALADTDRALSVVNLALRFGVEVDLDQVKAAIERLNIKNFGQLTFDAACARLAIILTSSDPNTVANELGKERDALSICFNPNLLMLLEVQVLCHAGRPGDATRLLEVLDGLDNNLIRLAEGLIAEAGGADPVESRLSRYQETDSIEDLEALIDALAEKGDNAQLADYAELLYSRTRTLDDAKRFIQSLDDSGQFERVDHFLDRNSELVETSSEISARYCLTQYHRGNLNEAWAMIQGLRVQEDNENLRTLFISICVASGRWDEFTQFATQELQAKDSRKPEELIRASHLVSADSPPLSRSLVEAAVEIAPSDPRALAAAYFIASNSGWEDSPEVGKWLRSAIELSDDSGPIEQTSLDDLIERMPLWNEHEAGMWERVRCAQLPISFAANALNRTQTELTLTQATANRKTLDPRRRAVIPSFHGRSRSASFQDIRSVVIEPAALLSLADLEILEDVIKSFERVLIPLETLHQLFGDIQKASFHQPSRLKKARALVDAVSKRLVTPLSVEPEPEAWLVRETGFSTAKLFSEANRLSQSGNDFAYVVHPGELGRPESLGREPADIKDLTSHLINCTQLIDHLHQAGAISRHDAKKAENVLRLRGDNTTGTGKLKDNSTLLLDNLAADYLLDLGLLSSVVQAGFKVHILQEQLDFANMLLEHEAHADEVKNKIESIRSVLTQGIASGRIAVGPAMRDETVGQEGNATVSALKCLENFDAMICDDRTINANLTASNADASRPIFTTLSLLDRLLDHEKLSRNSWNHSRHRLRQGNYFFVPLTVEEISYALDDSTLVDGQIKETAEMRTIREYLAAVTMSDWFKMPEEADWLTGIFHAIRTAIWSQWIETDKFDLAAARSAWLVDLFDYRDWVRFRPYEPKTINSLVAIQIFLLIGWNEIATGKSRDAFLNWLDTEIVAVLKDENPPAYAELVILTREAILEILQEHDNDSVRTAIAVSLMNSCPRSLTQSLLQDEELVRQVSLPARITVRISEPDPHFNQADLFSALRKVLSQPTTELTVQDIKGETWDFSYKADNYLQCTKGQTTIVLSEFRYLAQSKTLRIEGLRAIAEDALPKSDFDTWLVKAEKEPLSNRDVTKLQRDVFATPTAFSHHIKNAMQTGSLNWNDIVPISPSYVRRLVGNAEMSENLSSYLETGFKHWFADLPAITGVEKAKRALFVCAHGNISRVISNLLADDVIGSEILDWAARSGAPAVQVAALEVFLPWAIERNNLHEPLVELLDQVLSADLKSGNNSYRFYADLFLAVDGHVALGQHFAEASVFFRRLYAMAQTSFLQVSFSSPDVDTASLGMSMRQTRGPWGIMRTFVDMADWPRWYTKYFTPEMIHAQHLGRIWNAAAPLNEALPACELKSHLFGNSKSSLKSKLSFPVSFLPGPLDGARQTGSPQPPEIEAAIDEQLTRRPVSSQTFETLASAAMIFDISSEQIEKAVEALQTIEIFFNDITNHEYLFAVLDGLAHIAAQSRASLLATEIFRFCRCYAAGVQDALGYANALQIGLVASAAIESETERSVSLGKLVEHFAFSELNKEDCERLLGYLTTLCRVEPSLHPHFSKSRTALKAYKHSGAASESRSGIQ